MSPMPRRREPNLTLRLPKRALLSLCPESDYEDLDFYRLFTPFARQVCCTF